MGEVETVEQAEAGLPEVVAEAEAGLPGSAVPAASWLLPVALVESDPAAASAGTRSFSVVVSV